MKVECSNCKKDISKIVQSNFDEYIVGKYVCPNCKNKQKRYVSELDLMIYFGISCITYAVSIFVLFSIFQISSDLMFTSAFVLIVFIGLFILFRFITSWIYKNAPFKSNWKDYLFEEDTKLISKRMKWQFIMFLVVAFMFGTSEKYTSFFYVLIVLFIIVIFIKVYLLYKKELNIVSNKNVV